MSLDEDFLKKFKQNTLLPGERNAVESAARRTETREERTIDRSDTAGLIQNYLHRFSEILNRPDSAKRERGIEQLKRIIHEQFLIASNHPVFTVSSEKRMKEIIDAKRDQGGRPVDVEGKPYKLSHFDKLIIRRYEEGRGLGTITEEGRQQEIEDRIEEQRQSLDAWIDYLAEDTSYPDALKYWTFRSVLKMGGYDKEKQKFTNREGAGSIHPFPYLNMEALGVVLGDAQKKNEGKEDAG